MNKELYEMYIKSKPTVYGYMKRLKEIWDEKHPDENLEPRHLAEQVRNIKKKQLLSQSDIEQITTQEERQQQQQQQQQCMQQQQQRQRISIARDNNEESAPRIKSGGNNEETTATGRTMNNENSDPELDNGMKEANSIEKEHVRQVFRKNFNKYIEMQLTEREYKTIVKPTPWKNKLQLFDQVISEEISRIQEIYKTDLWTLNVMYYATAVTVMEIEGNLREEKKRRPERAKPGWQIRIESRIEAIRRKLSHTFVLTECFKNRRYTRHQNSIKSKMEKWYGKISINKLKSIQATLKQELAIESQKLKRRKTVQERWRINGLFKVAPKKVY